MRGVRSSLKYAFSVRTSRALSGAHDGSCRTRRTSIILHWMVGWVGKRYVAIVLSSSHRRLNCSVVHKCCRRAYHRPHLSDNGRSGRYVRRGPWWSRCIECPHKEDQGACTKTTRKPVRALVNVFAERPIKIGSHHLYCKRQGRSEAEATARNYLRSFIQEVGGGYYIYLISPC